MALAAAPLDVANSIDIEVELALKRLRHCSSATAIWLCCMVLLLARY
jgi:hypothetical protein